MKRFFQFLMASALVVSMQGCSNEPSDEISSAVELKLKGEIQTPMSGTRVNANGFETSDIVGVYVSSNGSLILDNAAYTYSNGNLNAPADCKVYWDSEDTRLAVYAYYPYSATVEDNSAYEFSVAANQSVAANYYNSDFITAKAEDIAPQEAPVSLTFQHSLSKINVSLVAGKGITPGELAEATKSFTIGGLVTDGKINLTTGVATAGSTKATITPLESNGKDYSAIVYPQSGAITFYMELDGEIFSYTTNVNFVAGCQYQFNLTINTWESPEMTLSTTTIDTWDDGEEQQPGTMSGTISFVDENLKRHILNHDLYAQGENGGVGDIMETKIDVNGDGEISYDEAKAVYHLIIGNGLEITNLSGLEYFTNLEYLVITKVNIADIDLSKNTSIVNLDFMYNNGPTSLTLSNNPNLKRVHCGNNSNLKTLDISGATALESLDCDHNQLTVLDASHNTKLTKLVCNYNQLTELNITNNPLLTHLDCGANKLTSLDVSNNTVLSHLQFGQNQVISIDVSHITDLDELYCGGNQLTSIDVSQNTKLECLQVENNKLTELNVSNNAKLKRLWCQDNQLTSLDVSNNTALADLDCNPMNDAGGNNLLSTIYLANGQTIESINMPEDANIVYK